MKFPLLRKSKHGERTSKFIGQFPKWIGRMSIMRKIPNRIPKSVVKAEKRTKIKRKIQN